ncbi:MAG: pectin acetylesterase-family hydrolase [Myxococcota bacterium]
MRLHFLLVAALLAVACGDDDGMMAGLPDAGGDLDMGSDVDAGTDTDMGMGDPDMGLMCPDSPTVPEAWDCTAATPIDEGDAITADANTWTWVPFPDTQCMDGTPFGIGVNINPESDRLMIFFEGGGACFDRTTCLTGVANRDGYDEEDFDETAAGRLLGQPFARDDETNPVRDFNMVYIPYCSGDVFGGNIEDSPSTTLTHVGRRNTAAILRRVLPTFPSMSDVLLTGSSAGGLGAVINYTQVQEAFGCTPVNMFNDAGAILTDEFLAPCQQQLLRDAWEFDGFIADEHVDAVCQEDGGGLVTYYAYLAQRYPDQRFAYATGVQDGTFRFFYSWGLSEGCDTGSADAYTGEMFEMGVNALRGYLTPFDNFNTFYLSGDNAQEHTFLSRLGEATESGLTLGEYLGDFIDPGADFVDAGP